jgi:chromosomal replication initiator protein
LSGKQKTQSELGYTLDSLANDNKRIICTSAVAPKDVPRMSGELTSRLTGGLVTTIGGPDFETRLRILTRKAAEHRLSVSGEIIEFLAERLKRDVRQMESALKSLKARAELLKAKVDLRLAKEVVACLVSGSRSVSLGEIAKLVCRYYQVEPALMQSASRKKVHAGPRNIYVYLSRHHTDETIQEIGKTINRSHSAVVYASELMERQIKRDEKTRRQVEFLSQKLEHMKK